MKVCSRCKQPKEESVFSKDRTRPDGLSCWCKACALASVRRWKAQNRERVNQRARVRYHKTLAESREEANRRKRRSYHKDVAKARAKAREAYGRRDKNIVRAERQRYRMTGVGRYITLKTTKRTVPLCSKEEFIIWWEQQELRCAYCGVEVSINKDMTGLTIDRKDPLKGYAPSNMAIVCRRCNTIKGYWFTPAQMIEINKNYLRR